MNIVTEPIVLKAEDLDQTYNGKGLGYCSCGCTGNYTHAGDQSTTALRRLARINNAIRDGKLVESLDYGSRICYELLTAGGTRVTRVYVKVA